MATVKLSAFTGEQPRVVPRLLPATAAQSAINARLDNGALGPYRLPELVTTIEGGPFNTIYRDGEEWLAFEGDVHLAPGPVADDRLYYTGDGVPKLKVGEDTYALELAAPETAPTAAIDGDHEVQAVTVDGTSGNFTVTFDGATTTALAFNISAGDFEDALEALTTIEVGDVAVTGGPGDSGGTTPYVVTFGGRFAYTNVPEMTADGTGLSGGGATATVATTTPGSGDGDIQTRLYVYTFVTDFGEESEPSPASNELEWMPGQTVTLTGIEDAPGSPDRNITKQRFYRSQSGTIGADLFFIAERDVSSDDFDDDIAPDAFAEPLPSRHYNPPPDDLEGLIALPNGMMAAFVGRQLYFSEPYRPHAWPEIYILTTDTPIVALAAAGTTVWVLTSGAPYRVTGTHPSAMVMDKVEANLPCVNARGVVDLGYAAAWPSNDGLAVGRSDGTVMLASRNLFAPRDWRRLNPGTMRAGQLEGRWIGSYSATDAEGQAIAGSLIIDLAQESFLIRSGVQASSWFYDIAAGQVFFLESGSNDIYLFDSPAASPDTLYWRSKQFVLPKPENFGAILIETGAGVSEEASGARQDEIDAIVTANEALLLDDFIGGDIGGATIGEVAIAGDFLEPIPAGIGSTATISVYANGTLVAAIGTLNRVTRLPAGFTARIWEIDAYSDIELVQITMSRTVDELKQMAAGP